MGEPGSAERGRRVAVNGREEFGRLLPLETNFTPRKSRFPILRGIFERSLTETTFHAFYRGAGI